VSIAGVKKFSMFYPTEIIEDVREQNDIVDVVQSYVKLTRRGNVHFGSCPFHRDKTPSFSVNGDKQLYHCFGCGASGNVITFIMNIENYDFVTTLKHLADRVHYTLPEKESSEAQKELQKTKAKLYEIHTESARFYYNNLVSPKDTKALNYLVERNLLKKTIRKFGLGYANDEWDSLYKFLAGKGFDVDLLEKSGLVIKNKKNGNYFDRFRQRVMFPIIDTHDRIIGFGGRTLVDDNAKYLNSPETPIFSKSHNLYGLNFARKNQNRECILVEGYMDVIALHQGGFTNAIASLGTSFNKNHSDVVKKTFKKVILSFDADDAGTRAILRAIPFLTQNNLKVNVLSLRDAKDPDEFLNKYGDIAFKEELVNSKDNIIFQIEQICKKFDLKKPQDKSDFVNEVSDLLKDLSLNDVDKIIYLEEVNKLTGVPVNLLKNNVNELSESISKTIDENIVMVKNKKNKDRLNNKNRGLNDAQSYLIYIVSEAHEFYEIVSDTVKPSDFEGESYIKIMQTLYKLHDEKRNTDIANLISYFSEKQDLDLIYEIFENPLVLNDKILINKAIDENIKIVNNYNLNKQLESTADSAAALQELFEKMKQKHKDSK